MLLSDRMMQTFDDVLALHLLLSGDFWQETLSNVLSILLFFIYEVLLPLFLLLALQLRLFLVAGDPFIRLRFEVVNLVVPLLLELFDLVLVILKLFLSNFHILPFMLLDFLVSHWLLRVFDVKEDFIPLLFLFS